MRKRILWLGLSFLLVAALVLASCGPAGEQEEEEEEEEEEEGAPQYGGTLTIGLHPFFSVADPPSPDIMEGGRIQLDYLFPIQEMPLVGDFEKYGGRGTGEFMFRARDGNPIQYMKGQLIEDWEVSDEKAVWHVRPGIYWAPNEDQIERGVMESRELVAADIVADLLYFRAAPAGAVFKGYTSGEINVIDRYTLEIFFSDGFNYLLMYTVGYEDRSCISPPETEGSDRWEDQVGTGPFMFGEYVVGSHMTYVRNPIYWQKATIDGVEYELPFVDEAIVPIIPDIVSQIAAIRTGTLDWIEYVDPQYWADLIETAGLEYYVGPGGSGPVLQLAWRTPPLNNVNVRRALLIGTDLDEFIKMMNLPGDFPTFRYPYNPLDSAWFSPLEEWPEDVQILYDYNPTLAKQMLADEGYPDGFTLELVTKPDPVNIDQVDLIVAQWAKIGVTVDVLVFDAVTVMAQWYEKTYKDLMFTDSTTADPIMALSWNCESDSGMNRANYSNPEVDVLIAKMLGEMDPDERMRLAKEAFLIVMPSVPSIPLQSGTDGHFWWPWMKNYYGERSTGDFSEPWHILAHVWIDEDLKAEMGF